MNNPIAPHISRPRNGCISRGAQLFGCLLLATAMSGGVHAAPRIFFAGSDVSYFGYIQQHGGAYKIRGKNLGLLQVFRKEGCNLIRLRLWRRATPAEIKKYGRSGTLNDLAYTLPLAQQVKRMGFVFDLNMHFSPTWADPGHQPVPAAWQGLTIRPLEKRIYTYCKRVITTLRQHHAMPDIVQPGNEMNNGILWPLGQLHWKNGRSRGWHNYLGLLRAAIGGIYDASPSGKRPLILIHVAMSSAATLTDYYNHLVWAHIPFDAIGVSVYPFWGGTLAKAKTTLQALAFRFNKPIFIAETAYPHLEQPGEHKLRGLRYPMSPAGQAEYVSREIAILHSLPHGLGCGIIYWGGELLPPPAGPGLGPWPGRSLFGAGGEALRSLDVLGRAAFPKVPVHMKSIVR